MTGSGGVNVPPTTQSISDLGGKQISELIEEGMTVTVSGTNVTLKGTAKKVDSWPQFSNDPLEQTGHFVPISMPAVCKLKNVTFKGRTNGDRTVQIDEDLLLVQRLENLEANKLTAEMDGKTLMVVDFTQVTRAEA